MRESFPNCIISYIYMHVRRIDLTRNAIRFRVNQDWIDQLPPAFQDLT